MDKTKSLGLPSKRNVLWKIIHEWSGHTIFTFAGQRNEHERLSRIGQSLNIEVQMTDSIVFRQLTIEITITV